MHGRNRQVLVDSQVLRVCLSLEGLGMGLMFKLSDSQECSHAHCSVQFISVTGREHIRERGKAVKRENAEIDGTVAEVDQEARTGRC